MKYNLKNCPCKYEEDYEPCRECEQWKKGFEKELREMRDKHARVHPCTECDKYFEEILGEP